MKILAVPCKTVIPVYRRAECKRERRNHYTHKTTVSSSERVVASCRGKPPCAFAYREDSRSRSAKSPKFTSTTRCSCTTKFDGARRRRRAEFTGYEAEERARARREFRALPRLFINHRTLPRETHMQNIISIGSSHMVYSPIEPAMSLFPPRARILPQFRQSEQNPTEPERRTVGRAEGEKKREADHHLVIS